MCGRRPSVGRAPPSSPPRGRRPPPSPCGYARRQGGACGSKRARAAPRRPDAQERLAVKLRFIVEVGGTSVSTTQTQEHSAAALVPSPPAVGVTIIRPTRKRLPISPRELWCYRELFVFLVMRDIKVR